MMPVSVYKTITLALVYAPTWMGMTQEQINEAWAWVEDNVEQFEEMGQ